MSSEQSSGCSTTFRRIIGIFCCIIGFFLLSHPSLQKDSSSFGVLLFIVGLVIFFAKSKKNSKKDFTKFSSSDVYLSSEQIKMLESGQQIPIVQTPLLLKSGENAIFFCRAVKQEVKEKVVGRTGSYGGKSFRIMKGVTIHSGKTASQPIYGKICNHIPGLFIMTTHRLVFINDSKGFEIPYKKLTSFLAYSDAISIQLQNTNHTLLLPRPDLVNTLFSNIQSVGSEKFAETLQSTHRNDINTNATSQRVCSCGTNLKENMKFCPTCGQKLK